MLDIKFIRENADIVADAARKKHIEFDIKKLLKADDSRCELLQEVEKMRAKQNETNGQISRVEGEAREALIQEMQELKRKLQKLEEKLKETMKKWQLLMLQVPNIPDMSVPEGKGDEDNVEVKVWGDKPSFSFEPKSQTELLKSLDLADLERGVKISGFRGYFLKNDGSNLAMAIWQFAMNSISEKGFTPMIVPALVNKEPFFGTGYLPTGEDDLYKTQDGTYLAGTGEVATMAYHMNETFNKEDLPKKMVAFSTCFRREIGSYGKDTKGLIRVHEFHKVEQVILCEASHELSIQFHEELLKNSEELMQALELPYHVVINSGGDLGLGQVKKYDIEAWVPSEERYRETHSCSYFHDFQTRRLNIKYRDGDKTRFVHSLNNTALATPRLLVPILENYQQEDGSVIIPQVLRKYMQGRKSITPPNNS